MWTLPAAAGSAGVPPSPGSLGCTGKPGLQRPSPVPRVVGESSHLVLGGQAGHGGGPGLAFHGEVVLTVRVAVSAHLSHLHRLWGRWRGPVSPGAAWPGDPGVEGWPGSQGGGGAMEVPESWAGYWAHRWGGPAPGSTCPSSGTSPGPAGSPRTGFLSCHFREPPCVGHRDQGDGGCSAGFCTWHPAPPSPCLLAKRDTHKPPPGSSWVEGRAFWPGPPSCVGDGGSMRWNMRGVRFWGGREQHVYIRWPGGGGSGDRGKRVSQAEALVSRLQWGGYGGYA